MPEEMKIKTMEMIFRETGVTSPLCCVLSGS